jgi:hypothetical protein
MGAAADDRQPRSRKERQEAHVEFGRLGSRQRRAVPRS